MPKKNQIQHSSAVAENLQTSGHVVHKMMLFRIIYTYQSYRNLKYTEAVTITIEKPFLCMQKELVTQLRLPWENHCRAVC